LKKVTQLFLITFSIIITGCNHQKSMHNDLQSLIETELAFAQASKEKGMQHAFLIFLADDAIVFNPEPVKGKQLYAKKKNESELLNWKPCFCRYVSGR